MDLGELNKEFLRLMHGPYMAVALRRSMGTP